MISINLKKIKRFYKSLSIDYGFLGKDGQIYRAKDLTDEEFDTPFLKYYQLQSPQSLKGTKAGVCWDVVELERKFFVENDIPHKCYYIELSNREKASHTILVFYHRDKSYWFEYSWYDYRGISGPYTNDKKIITSVANKMKKQYKESLSYKVWEYPSPPVGSSIMKFMKYIYKNGNRII